MSSVARSVTWYEHALAYIDMKWPDTAGKIPDLRCRDFDGSDTGAASWVVSVSDR